MSDICQVTSPIDSDIVIFESSVLAHPASHNSPRWKLSSGTDNPTLTPALLKIDTVDGTVDGTRHL